jgi:hypothetical protein
MNAWLTQQIAAEQITDRRHAAAERRIREELAGPESLFGGLTRLITRARVPAVGVFSWRHSATTLGCNA